jgi:hypothetical protein
MSLLSRIVYIVIAFLLASIAAGITIAFALLGLDWPALSGSDAERSGFWTLVVFASALSGAVCILPFFLLTVVAEGYRLRSALLYPAVGAITVVLGYFLSGFADRTDGTSVHLPVIQEVQIAAAAGIAFGFVYWLFAGRKAGMWRSLRL